MAKLIHDNLTSLGVELGYSNLNKGLCQGFSGMLCQAWLANDSDTFFKRLNFIETYNNDVKQLTKDIDEACKQEKEKPYNKLNEKTKTLLKIRDFRQLRDDIDKARKQEKEKTYDQLDEKTKLLLSDFKQLQKDIDPIFRSKIMNKTPNMIFQGS